MPSVVYRTKPNGSQYAYRSESYWDKEKQAPRTRTIYLGKVDEESGQIMRVYKKKNQKEAVPSSDECSAPSLEGDHSYELLLEEIRNLKTEIQQLREETKALTSKLQAAKDFVSTL